MAGKPKATVTGRPDELDDGGVAGGSTDGSDAYDDLTPRARRFVDLICEGMVAWDAYRKAGFKGVKSTASSKMAVQHRAAIEWRRDELSKDSAKARQRSIERITRYAEGSLDRLVDIKGGEISFKDWEELTPEDRALVSEVSETETGMKIKLEPRMAAEARLAKLHGWDHSGESKTTVTLDGEGAAEIVIYSPENRR